jgi:hypothetical protein
MDELLDTDFIRFTSDYYPCLDIEDNFRFSEYFENQEKREALFRVLETLEWRPRFVLVCRFFSGLTLEETGRIIGVQGERVRQIEAKALRILRHDTRIELLPKSKEFIKKRKQREAKEAKERERIRKLEERASHIQRKKDNARRENRKRVLEFERKREEDEQIKRAKEAMINRLGRPDTRNSSDMTPQARMELLREWQAKNDLPYVYDGVRQTRVYKGEPRYEEIINGAK